MASSGSFWLHYWMNLLEAKFKTETRGLWVGDRPNYR